MNDKNIEIIYQQYHHKVLLYVQARVKNPTEAEDITSDIFVKVMAGLDSFDSSKAQFSTWIYTIASNAIKDHIRKVTVRNKYSCSSSDVFLESIVSDECSCDEKLFENESLELLADALESLSERERRIVVLHYYKDLPHKEIAKELSLTYSNVRYINHQAIKKIKAYFQMREFV
ncbi:MAG: sigma-70 family RNA polymerase sigma factor [Eubacteriales bacterium]|nr:sigma-70 family RNA polymerase sigma factor [Eubacteriales bacterium]